MSHVKFTSAIKQTLGQEKITEAKIEKLSDAVTVILRNEAAAKMKKLMYVFVNVTQQGPTSFAIHIDDSRDKISAATEKLINSKFEEIFAIPANK